MESLANLLETAMLVCFGLSWPMNLIKNYKARSAKAMSLPFIVLIISGYVAGIIAKIIKGIDLSNWYVFAVYILNLVMVSGNLVVYFINRNLDKKAEAALRK